MDLKRIVVRKISKNLGSYTIFLPKMWCDMMGWTPGKYVDITTDGEKLILRLMSEEEVEEYLRNKESRKVKER